MEEEITKTNECWYCKHKKEVPCNAHIRCDKSEFGKKRNAIILKN